MMTPGYREGGKTPVQGSMTPNYEVGNRTPHFGSMTPSHDGSKTPTQAWDPAAGYTPARVTDNDLEYPMDSGTPYAQTPNTLYSSSDHSYSPYQAISPSGGGGYNSKLENMVINVLLLKKHFFFLISGSNSYMNTPSPINTASPRSIQYHPAPSPSNSFASIMTPSSVSSSPGLTAPSLTSFGKRK